MKKLLIMLLVIVFTFTVVTARTNTYTSGQNPDDVSTDSTQGDNPDQGNQIRDFPSRDFNPETLDEIGAKDGEGGDNVDMGDGFLDTFGRDASNEAQPELNSSSDEKSVTIMVYIAGDNDLDSTDRNEVGSYYYRNVTGLEQAVDPENVNVIVLYDRWSGEFEYYHHGDDPKYARDEDNRGMKIYYIEPDDDPDEINSKEITSDLGFEAGIIDSGDAKNLEKFINASIENYPADRYFLDIGSHGAGVDGVATDYTHNSRFSMAEGTTNSLPQVIGTVFGRLVSEIQEENGIKLEILSFDACLMASLEVNYDIINNGNVDYIVASQQPIPGDGFDYAAIFSDAADKTSKQITDNMVENYVETYNFRPNKQYPGENLTSVAGDLENHNNYTNAMGEIFNKLNQAYADMEQEEQVEFMENFHEILINTRNFGGIKFNQSGGRTGQPFFDAVDFLNKLDDNRQLSGIINENIEDDLINQAKNSLLRVISSHKTNTLATEEFKNEAHGVSIYLEPYQRTLGVSENTNIYGDKLANFAFANTPMYEQINEFMNEYYAVMRTLEDSNFFDGSDNRI
ncbi:MAG: clostripain-related cysteine peptidase [Candidatus Muiribacteriota bacterium]